MSHTPRMTSSRSRKEEYPSRAILFSDSASARLAWLVVGLSAVVSCTDPQVPPPVSLNGPTQMALGRYCLVDDGQDERLRLLPEACDTEQEDRVLRQWAYVTNQFGNSVALVDFNASTPRLVDIDDATPGVTHMVVGDAPTDVVVSRDGNLVFTLNQVGQDISVVVADLAREYTRVPVGRPLVDLIALGERDALIYLTPDDNTLHEVTWTLVCPGEEPGIYREECEPELAFETNVFYTFPEGWTPNSVVRSEQERLFVTFDDRSTLAEILVKAPEEGDAVCVDGRSEPPCVTRELGLTFGCVDGVDNDGDGLIDAADPQCVTASSAESAEGAGRGRNTVCNDGEDNDNDGTIDADDAGCTSASDDSETDALTPVDCPDGFVNGDCLTTVTGAALIQPPTECTDGIDNDLDGAFDLDDPACSNPNNTTESGGVSACSDGVDNDGDGLVDYPDDPNCYSRAGSTEETRVVNAYGPIAIDPEGRFAYVVDRTLSHVLVLDLEAGRLMDANIAFPTDDRLGVPVGRLPLSITARQQEFFQTFTNSDGDVVRRVSRKIAFANVAASRGVAYYAEAAEYYNVYEGDSEEPSQTLRNDLLRLRDENSSAARATSINCDLDDEIVARIREARQDTEDSRGSDISCRAEELPQINPLPSRCLAECTNGQVCPEGTFCFPLGDVSTCVAGDATNPRFPDGALLCDASSDCNDPDGDGVASAVEDRNGDGDPDNDDTDGDGAPDYLDLDDDDDDIPTDEEDINRDGDPTNDDTNGDGVPNYLDPNDAMGVEPAENAGGGDANLCASAGADGEVSLVVDSSGDPEEITFPRRRRDTFEMNAETGAVSQSSATPVIDYRLITDTWRVVYEGNITERSDTIVAQTDGNGPTSLILSQGGDFCSSGVQPGDLLTLDSDPTPLSEDAGGPDCEGCGCYRDVDLLYRVEDVQGNQLVISVIEDAEGLNRDASEDPIVSVLPSRECFGAGVAIAVRADGEWIVAGDRAGLLVNSRRSSGVCVPRYDWDAYRFRVSSGEQFRNPYFAFTLSDGTITPTRGFEYTFRTFSGFSSLLISVGPSTTDIQQIDTSAGSYLPILDATTNIIRVYDATSLRLLNVLF